MQIMNFENIEDLNKFLIEMKDDPHRYVKSVKTKSIEKIVFFVMIDEKTFSGQHYNPRGQKGSGLE